MADKNGDELKAARLAGPATTLGDRIDLLVDLLAGAQIPYDALTFEALRVLGAEEPPDLTIEEARFGDEGGN